jgi:hypothetical protein
MLIQIQPIQVPQFWDMIKFAAISTDNISEEHKSYYLLTLLQDLLAGKKTAFVIQNKENAVTLVVIIEVKRDELTNTKIMFMTCLYSFERQPEKNWDTAVMDLAIIAKVTGCVSIVGDTASSKLGEILERNGGSCVTKRYVYTF